MRALLAVVTLLTANAFISAQAQLLENSANDAVRVTIAQNQDGSRTTYQYDNANHKAVATTKNEDGKLVSKIRYNLDELGRFAAGEVYDGEGKLRFKTLYKYDSNARLAEETQLTTEGKVRSKIVYSYNEAGKQTGYVVYDGAGNQLGHITAPGTSTVPANPKGK